ncbi:c-type cytochrome [Methyloterricola oryzae]|uniref:c-type cytochrome n=1 Tax=Methyloterricola oryzae TaxID=1495050 RepID=UPI001F344797|nr:cytochrome c [Methyloterricola oryzae]
MLNRVVFAALCLIASTGQAVALDLPVPEKLERQYALKARTVEVVEPHTSTPDDPLRVRYRALPADELLGRWFGEGWKAQDAAVVFFARDGYRSVIPASRFARHRAYLAFGREDGAAFAVDNRQQHEQGIALGPYYLIWDNLGSEDLLRQGAYGWPYQVTRVELQSAADERRLLPSDASPEVLQGFEASQEYCLTCHHIRGMGGAKVGEDLAQAACRWKPEDLKAWMIEPARWRPGTAMPPLNPRLSESERSLASERIAAFLAAQPHESGCALSRPGS